MNFKLNSLRLLAAMRANYRKGPARVEFDRQRLAQQRIAVVKMDGIGDFTLASGLLQLIRRELPRAEVAFFCRQPVGPLAQQQLPGWPVMEIFDPRCSAREILLDKATRRRLESQKPFDVLLDLRAYRSFIEPVIASWIPARQKIAPENLRMDKGQWLRLPREDRIYDQLVRLPDTPPATGLSQDLQNNQALARWLFPHLPAAEKVFPRLIVEAATRKQVVEMLAARFQLPPEQPFLLVCPGTSTPLKEYPVAVLAEAILNALKGCPMPVVIAGGKGDSRTTQPLEQQLHGRCPVINVSGVFSLPQHLALVAQARALLSMDSCHAHFAGALGTPAVVILGGGQYGAFGPWGESATFRWLTHRVPCFGCNWNCIHDRPLCIQDVPAAVIATNLGEVLRGGVNPSPGDKEPCADTETRTDES